MNDTSLPTALIAGATSGFGRAIALRLAAAGTHRLVLCGRRKERLDQLKGELNSLFQTPVQTLAFDLRNRAETEAAIGNFSLENDNIMLLVNNAGLAAGRHTADAAILEDWDQMIETNLTGLARITRLVVPKMMAAGGGHIVNMGSTASKETYSGGSMYCATKHAVDAFTKVIRAELVSHGIRVSQICPGAAETEFSLVRFKGDAAAAAKVYEGFQPLSADDVADVFMYIVTRPAHVCIQDVIITPAAQANSGLIHRTA